MSFFKNLKSKLLGSVKEDLNSALGSKRMDFNSKISGALDDLIALKTGINISNVPKKISEQAIMSAQDRANAEKSIEKRAADLGRNPPSNRDILKFPTDDNRFVDNWIVFRTVNKKHVQDTTTNDVVVPASPDRNRSTDLSSAQQSAFGAGNYGVNGSEGLGSAHTRTNAYTIALYFPTGVKDSVSVEYEAKEIGLSDIMMDDLLTGEFGSLYNSLQPAMKEQFMKAKQAMVSFEAFQSGTVIDNPKFNTYQGVSFRDHSYSFNLNPYNEVDANAITKIIHTFKMMMLPMSSHTNPRNMIMPAEWTIDFMGPILGHIEHPQNCFLKSCDVDYSGGKDMSFIESFSSSVAAIEDDPDTDDNEGRAGVAAALQHYPNGVNMTLNFQEILNLDRLRYVQRVSPYAMGAAQDTGAELKGFETVLMNEMHKSDPVATEEEVEGLEAGGDGSPASYDASWWWNTRGRDKRSWNRLSNEEKNEWMRSPENKGAVYLYPVNGKVPSS